MTPAYELPAWLGAFYVPIPRWRFPAMLGDLWKYDEALVRAEWDKGLWRVIGRAESRHSLVVVSVMYAWPARLEWWWHRNAQWRLLDLLWRIGVLRQPYAGCLYTELRLAHWGDWFV